MPYTTDSPPATVKNLPKGAQRIFIDTFNAVVKDGGSEENARMAAWRNVKAKYKKVGDKWVAKEEHKMPDQLIEVFVTPITLHTITEGEQTYNVARWRASRGDEENANHRVYPTALWQREAQSIAEGKKVVLGQSSHPYGHPDLLDSFLKFDKAFMEDKDFIAEAKVIATSKGKDFVEIAKAGVPIAVSTRGTGTVKKETREGKEVFVVQDDYALEGIDVLVQGTQSFRDAAMMHFEAMSPEEAASTEAQATPSETEQAGMAEKLADLEKQLAEAQEKIAAATQGAATQAEKIAELEKQFDEAADAAEANKNQAEALALKHHDASEQLKTISTERDGIKQELVVAHGQLAAHARLVEMAQGQKFALPLITKLAELKSVVEVEATFPKEAEVLMSQLGQKLPQGRALQNPNGSDPREKLEPTEAEKKVAEQAQTLQGLFGFN